VKENDDTILSADDSEFLGELSGYLEVLGNSTRLRIIRLLEKEAMDARTLSRRAGISYENTKKHLEKLLGTGLVTRVPGLGRETSKGIHPAWNYLPVPGVLERIQRDLGVIAAVQGKRGPDTLQQRIAGVRQQIGKALGTGRWMLLVMGGEWDGKTIPLSTPVTELGRGKEGGISGEEGITRIAFPPAYRSVTRLEKPHAVVRTGEDGCTIEDAGSRGGTFINGRKIIPHDQTRLKDGDRIVLSQGDFPVTLLVLKRDAVGEHPHA
jgi:DNA-binding transcriptional ArsR family regulator